ncbi:uncharacterized protein [Pocillopora verrucosa]|uniref:uncharacterized protein n=1 Tax=Pocillopora verrucosa TaxID=203993 RepID=UPI00334163B0
MFLGFICSLFIIWLNLLLEPAASQGGHDIYRPPQTVRQHVFVREEFRYLNVPRIGFYTVDDSIDCAFNCLSHTSCFSVNLAASRGMDGKFWCELLSSDKYRNSTELLGNKSSHHFVTKSPCSSSPCKNEGTCVPSYKYGIFECLCKKGFIGEFCEKGFKSCRDAYNSYNSNASELVTLHFGAKTTSVLCQMGDFGCGDGGWTPVMKIDGNKNTFLFSSGYWTDKSEFNPSGGTTGFDSQETKLPTYWNTPFSKVCLGMKVNGLLRFTLITSQASSLHSLIADGHYRSTSLGRNKWIALTNSKAHLQPNCNKEGFNTQTIHRRARVGILGNNENDCNTCDSVMGFGLDSTACGDLHSFRALCYILVQ